MDRCDFSSVVTIIRRYISEDKGMNQIDFTYLLFDTFMSSDEAADYDFDAFENKISFMTKALCFAMERNFVKRDTKTRQLLSVGALSPVLLDYVMGNEVPRLCKFFCGRSEELQALHSLFEKDSKIFLYGIAGIGKSELAKAYAREYRKDYTNILYLTYGGDLWQDIMDMDFVDDLSQDTDEERFKKHNRFLRSLKEDTLLIVDNFNAMPAQDSFLPVMLKYRCRILFTTRSVFDGRSTMRLQEISDMKVLVQLVSRLYSETEKYYATVEQIIDAVHRHTFAVELAARLLENGILLPDTLLKKLQEEKAALENNDKINMVKDGQSSKATYYGHIHTFFSLYRLSETHQDIMLKMALIPVTGISVHRFAAWMCLADMGEPSHGMAALRKLSGVIKENHSDMSGDYAVIQEAMGDICLAQGNARQATEYFKRAIHIYEVIWEDAPELIEEKYNEIMGLYPQIGSVLGQYVAQALQKS